MPNSFLADHGTSMVTSGEAFAQLIEYLRKAEEAAAMLAHLKADEDKLVSKGWLGVAEMLKRTCHQVTQLATRGLQ